MHIIYIYIYVYTGNTFLINRYKYVYIYLRLPLYVFFLLFQKKSFFLIETNLFGLRAFFDVFGCLTFYHILSSSSMFQQSLSLLLSSYWSWNNPSHLPGSTAQCKHTFKHVKIVKTRSQLLIDHAMNIQHTILHAMHIQHTILLFGVKKLRLMSSHKERNTV